MNVPDSTRHIGRKYTSFTRPERCIMRRDFGGRAGLEMMRAGCSGLNLLLWAATATLVTFCQSAEHCVFHSRLPASEGKLFIGGSGIQAHAPMALRLYDREAARHLEGRKSDSCLAAQAPWKQAARCCLG